MSKPSLLFGEVTEDEPLFSNKGSTGGLSSLFGGASTTNTKAADASLTYQAPKQPSTTAATTSASTTAPAQKKPVSTEPPQVIFALPVQLFQFDSVSSKYKQIGKVGAAILGNRLAARYQLLLYHSNKQQIALVNITNDFGFTIQNNVYANFYDEAKQNWSLLFRSQEEAIKFAYQIALARSGSNEFKTPLYQELIVGPKGKGAQIGDTITVKYSVFGETGGQVGNAIDSPADPIKFRLGEASLMPRSVEDQIVGLKKTGRRVIVTSMENSTYKLINNNVTANSLLLVDLELIKLKKNERTGSVSKPKLPDLSTSLPDTDSTSFSLPSITSEDTTSVPAPSVISTSNTDQQQDTKGDLLARMAKLGRPAMGGVVPASAAKSNAKVDTEVEDTPTPTQTPNPTPIPTPVHTPAPTPVANTPAPNSPIINGPNPNIIQQHIPTATTTSPIPTHLVAPQQVMLNNPYEIQQQQQQQQQPQQFYGGNTGYSAQHMYNPSMYNTGALNSQQRDWRMPAPGNNPPPMDTLSLLMEERQFQTDIKSSLNSVSNKVSEIYTKLEHSSLFQSGKSEIPGLLILQNIQRIIEENEKLKIDLNQKTEYIDTLRGKISVLHEKNEKMIEENNRIMEQRNESLKESSEQTRKRLIDLLEEKTKLERELNDVSLTLSDTNRQLGSLNRQYVNTKAELTSTQEEVERLNRELETSRIAKNTSENSAKHLSNSLEQETQLRQLTERELAQAKIRNDQLSKELSHLQLVNSEKDNEHASRLDSLQKSFANERQTFEQAIDQLRDTLNKERLASGAASKDMLDRIEKESESKYSMLLQDRERQLAEKFELESRHREDQFNSEINTLRDQLINLQSSPSNEIENLLAKIKELQEELVNARNTTNTTATTTPAPSQADTVKKIMNGIYFSLYDQFEEEESYTGENVLQALMTTIKETTLKMLQDTSSSSPSAAPVDNEEEEQEEQEEFEEPPQPTQPETPEKEEEKEDETEVAITTEEIKQEEESKEETVVEKEEETELKPQIEETKETGETENTEENTTQLEKEEETNQEVEVEKQEEAVEVEDKQPEEAVEEQPNAEESEVSQEIEEEEEEQQKEKEEEEEVEEKQTTEEEKGNTSEKEEEESKTEEEEKKIETKSGLFDTPSKKSSNPLFEDDENDDQKDAWKSFLSNNL